MNEMTRKPNLSTVLKKVLLLKLRLLNSDAEETVTQKFRKAVQKIFNADRQNAVFYN